MKRDEAWSWLESFTNLEKDLSAAKRTWRLDRMEALLADRRHPEVQGLSVHLAGSKGKGSTAAFLSSIFTASGQSTGLYTSPHVNDWRERITHNGTFFDERIYQEGVAQLKQYWDHSGRSEDFTKRWGGSPTTFEWLTLLAFEIFSRTDMDARVWETGLGGRLDATNTQTPSAVVLTLIEREHTDILGETISEIAGEKAGIIKPGVPTFVAPQSMDALAVFRREAERRGAPIRIFDEEIEELETRLTRTGTDLRVVLRDGTCVEARIPLLGQAQGLNAAVAIWTVHGLVESGIWQLTPGDELGDILKTGLESTSLPGRMQVLVNDPWFVVDGAHTVESIRLLVRSWIELAGPGHTLIFGAFEGKRVDEMAKLLAPHFSRIILTRPGTFRPSHLDELAQAFRLAGVPDNDILVTETPHEAAEIALDIAKPILACGSFYLAGELSKLSFLGQT